MEKEFMGGIKSVEGIQTGNTRYHSKTRVGKKGETGGWSRKTESGRHNTIQETGH